MHNEMAAVDSLMVKLTTSPFQAGVGGGSQLSCTAVELVMSTVTLRTPSDGAAEANWLLPPLFPTFSLSQFFSQSFTFLLPRFIKPSLPLSPSVESSINLASPSLPLILHFPPFSWSFPQSFPSLFHFPLLLTFACLLTYHPRQLCPFVMSGFPGRLK